MPILSNLLNQLTKFGLGELVGYLDRRRFEKGMEEDYPSLKEWYSGAQGTVPMGQVPEQRPMGLPGVPAPTMFNPPNDIFQGMGMGGVAPVGQPGMGISPNIPFPPIKAVKNPYLSKYVFDQYEAMRAEAEAAELVRDKELWGLLGRSLTPYSRLNPQAGVGDFEQYIAGGGAGVLPRGEDVTRETVRQKGAVKTAEEEAQESAELPWRMKKLETEQGGMWGRQRERLGHQESMIGKRAQAEIEKKQKLKDLGLGSNKEKGLSASDLQSIDTVATKRAEEEVKNNPGLKRRALKKMAEVLSKQAGYPIPPNEYMIGSRPELFQEILRTLPETQKVFNEAYNKNALRLEKLMTAGKVIPLETEENIEADPIQQEIYNALEFYTPAEVRKQAKKAYPNADLSKYKFTR